MHTLKGLSTICILGIALTASAGNAQTATDPSAQAVAGAAMQIDPVGMYDFVATLGIEDRTGTLEIVRDEAGAYGGEARVQDENAPAIIESGTVEGSHVALVAWVNGSIEVRFDLDFAGDGFEGTITANGQAIDVVGTRRAQ